MNTLLDVVGVQAHADFSLVLTFENSEVRRFDMAPYMNQKPWSRLREPSLFCSARAEMGTVVWPGNIDIDPETLLRAIRGAGALSGVSVSDAKNLDAALTLARLRQRTITRTSVCLGVPDKRPLADFLPTITIKAKDFANEITNFNINKDDLRNEPAIAQEHIKNTQSFMLRLLAAMKRTSTFTGRVEPSGRTSFSWMTRSSLTCMDSDISVTSSRNRVPPPAATSRPVLPMAPVKAPFSWPNSSLASSSSLKAPQLTARKLATPEPPSLPTRRPS